MIRPRALGNFRDLLGAVAKSPAMLFYLDQFQSTVDSTHTPLAAHACVARACGEPASRARARGLNENYARELLELHTLGVDGGYTQRDVIEVARALTGWTMNPRQGGEFIFRPEIHDADAKIVLGHRLAAGRGIEDGEEVLDIVARSPATARFIARKLAIRFVSDDPPPALVDRAARDLPLDRRRHSRDGAHDRHEPGVLQPHRVSRQGEEPVRARRVGAARARCAARHDTALRADWSRSSVRRSSDTRRRTDGRRRETRG